MLKRLSILLPVFVMASTASLAQQTYLPAGKLGPAEKLIIRSIDGNGKSVYSDHFVEGTRIKETFRQQNFSTVAPPPLAPTAASSASSAPKAVTQEQIDAQNKKIEEANAVVTARNCDTARRELALLDSGRRMAQTNEKGEAVTLDENAKQQRRQDLNAVMGQNCKN